MSFGTIELWVCPSDLFTETLQSERYIGKGNGAHLQRLPPLKKQKPLNPTVSSSNKAG